MTIATNPAPVFGRTARGLPAASLEDHSWIAVPAGTGLRITNAWRLKKAMADWAEEDFWGSCGIVVDEAAFRAHVSDCRAPPRIAEAFSSDHGRAAESLIAYYPDAWEAIHGIELAPGQSRVKDERRFREVHAADWIVISAVRSDNHPGMVDCVATMSGARGAVPVRHYRVPVGEYAPGAFGFVIDPDRHEQVEPSALSA